MPIDMNSSIKEMINVGVTAKLASPLYNLSAALQSSSTETDCPSLHRKYQKFLNEKTSTQSDETLDNSKNLYQLKTIDELRTPKATPSKIEFLLYRRSHNANRRLHRKSKKHVRQKKSHTSIKRLLESESKSEELRHRPRSPPPVPQETSFVQKLKKSLGSMNKSKKSKQQQKNETLSPKKSKTPKESRIDIYPFDHGCAEYLRTTDFAPQIISELLAQRATDYATRFWAEVFGSLHIGVAFVLTFFLQTYRFLLYSVVKSTVVGFLQMTSDYGFKPLLTVMFNGFFQPMLIFMHNILSSMRDVLKPISETMDSFLKPLGHLLRSIRLITFKESRSKKLIKDV
ncbi:uncharacterized protein LOC129941421 [Eupeodes corollae]|uniref:uncharacterized protein LOC129941421 n=1 Tax=Eupeodes corollae TaxID=290404 RepID=UPI0024904E7E|nr:uncharacterized protein LOC129941421 [Eupeodes corollae]